MSRLHVMLVAGTLVASASPAAAQVTDYTRGSPYMRPPTLSPYLNLALGRDPGVNYYMGVRSEMDRRLNDRILGTAIRDIERRTEPRDAEADLFPTLPGTGHPAAFAYYGSYFNMTRPPGTPPTLAPRRR